MLKIQELRSQNKVIFSRKADLRYELDTILDKLKKEIKAELETEI